MFVIEFSSQADRDYYVKEDSWHGAMRERMVAMFGHDLVNAQTVDYVPGSF